MRSSYIPATALIVSGASGGSEAAAAFSRAWRSVRAPGMAQLTPSNMSIQRNANEIALVADFSGRVRG